MEGLETSELTTCENCNLSRVQLYVSCEPKPTLFEPLDDVFIDTIGKLTTVYNRLQFAVMLYAISRMR